jgi:hypothetical protein
MSLRCLVRILLSKTLPRTKHTPDVAIKTVNAAKALREIVAYDIKFMIGCNHEWEFSQLLRLQLSTVSRWTVVLQAACACAGVRQLTSNFDFIARQLDDEGRAERNIPQRRPGRVGAGSGATRGGAAATAPAPPPALAPSAAGESVETMEVSDIAQMMQKRYNYIRGL